MTLREVILTWLFTVVPVAAAIYLWWRLWGR